MFTEKRKGPIAACDVRWLVSCKDHSRSGRSVNEQDLGAIVEKATQHGAAAFLLVTTTTASTGAKAMLDAVGVKGIIETLIWDRHELEEMLLRAGHLDLVKRFLPDSYASYMRLGSLPQALASLEALVPKTIHQRIVKVIDAYHADGEWLTGRLVWPHDAASSETIDAALAALLERGVPAEAASILVEGEIEFDAFAALLATLKAVRPQRVRDLCDELVKTGNADGIALCAYRFAVEDLDADENDKIRLATHLATEDLDELYRDDLSLFIDRKFSTDPSRHSAWTDLDALSSRTRIDEVTLDSIVFAADAERAGIDFRADVTVSVELSYDREAASGSSFPGVAEGRIEASGFSLRDVRVDTGSFYE